MSSTDGRTTLCHGERLVCNSPTPALAAHHLRRDRRRWTQSSAGTAAHRLAQVLVKGEERLFVGFALGAVTRRAARDAPAHPLPPCP